uniref:BAI1-associated protein 3 isoform X1 n=1 Tax=Petromyzon marinus TaxID=7757 RepID=A0AAJ7TYP9_PETMA|nr:BAI1-associated protein 3 isoform X1 [Petromyzon marinus]XP_032826033.1 BAI1-associated protein 3 isoform X1 [Petromyzon marinus]XP_032826034.1 BAI1-associated protein 3 isoform X1 [Petromyzon marinus]XP_032826035.1 BAI1-associated protein 3 isoform X1 [Petromyzon marinus]XP_032826036.1 BAI1-associated protein 3 isoform X1 [Petromyzon marinus]
MASVRRKSQKERVLLARQATMPAAPVHEGILQAARAPISCFSATPEVKADQGFFERVGSILDQYRNPDLLESTVSAPLLEEAPVQGKLMENVKLSKRELDNLYEEALYTIMHRSGETTEDYVNEDYELYGYLKRVFNLSQMDHEALMEKVKEAKPPVQVLKVTVVEAKGLMSKDPDGFSDPYCMLGIMPGSKDSPREAAEEKKERKFSLRRRSDKRTPSIKEVLPAKFIQATEVKPHTLDPQWKESFSLDIDDIQTDTLHLDIWDHDDDVSVVEACSKLNEVHSLKGMGSYFKQIVKSARTTNASGSAEEHVDDFLGCLDIPLNDLPSTGVDKWCKLEPRTSSSKVQGWCHLLLNLTSSQRDTLLSKKVSNVTVYEMLMEHFIAYQHNMQGGLSTWDGELSKCAKTVLHQHAVQTDIPPAQQAILHWQAYSKYHQANAISYTCLHNALQQVEQSFQDASVAHEQQQSLAESFNGFLEFCLGLLRKIRDVFPSTNPEATSRLEALLGCLSEFYGTQVFKKACPFHNDLYLEINSVIKKGTQEWYEQMNSTFKAGGKSEEEKLQGLVKITNAVLSDLYKNRDHYNKMFASAVKVEYFSVTYRQLEKLISDEVSSCLEEPGGSSEGDVGALSQPSGEAMLQLYLNLRELHGLSDSLPARDGKPLALASFHGWFKVLMLRWLQLVHQKAKERISESVKADGKVSRFKLDFLNAQVKYSSSALSTTECLSHIRDLWKGLQWPPASATPILSKLMQNFCNCAHFYMELVKRKVEAGGYYRADGQFDVSNQLCVALNGMEYVRQFVCALPKELGLTDAEAAGAPAVGGGLPVGGGRGGGHGGGPAGAAARPGQRRAARDHRRGHHLR